MTATASPPTPSTRPTAASSTRISLPAILMALAVLNKATDAVLPCLPEKALNRDEMVARPHKNIAFTWDETYTLPENFYLAYQRGAGARFQPVGARAFFRTTPTSARCRRVKMSFRASTPTAM